MLFFDATTAVDSEVDGGVSKSADHVQVTQQNISDTVTQPNLFLEQSPSMWIEIEAATAEMAIYM